MTMVSQLRCKLRLQISTMNLHSRAIFSDHEVKISWLLVDCSFHCKNHITIFEIHTLEDITFCK